MCCTAVVGGDVRPVLDPKAGRSAPIWMLGSTGFGPLSLSLAPAVTATANAHSAARSCERQRKAMERDAVHLPVERDTGAPLWRHARDGQPIPTRAAPRLSW